MRTDKEQLYLINEKLTARRSVSAKKRAVWISVIAAVLTTTLILSSVIVLPGLLKKKGGVTLPVDVNDPATPVNSGKDVKNEEYYVRPEGGSENDPHGLPYLGDDLSDKHDWWLEPSAMPTPVPEYEGGDSKYVIRGDDTVVGPEPTIPGVIDEHPVDYDPQVDYRPGQLTGAELKDLLNYEEFVKSIAELKTANGNNPLVNVNALHLIKVTVKNGETPVAGAKVRLDGANYAAVTDNKGVAYLFYNLKDGDQYLPVSVSVAAGGAAATASVVDENGAVKGEVAVQLQTESPAKKLDMMFMIDTTGSMSDELEYLKSEIKDIIARVYNDGEIPVRTSVNFYRDATDQYIVHNTPFTDNADEVYGYINAERADGGGDYPEAVHTALDCAVNGHAWDEDAIKLCFVVLDAPPHSEQAVADSLYSTINDAAEKGIRIIPIVSSGSDQLTEYLMRTYAALTGGTYTFLTNHSGIGNPHADPTTDTQYSVEMLNDMIVRIVKEYCA